MKLKELATWVGVLLLCWLILILAILEPVG
jgi:hypothetical protein